MTRRREPLVIRSGGNPFELIVLAVMMLVGTIGIADPQARSRALISAFLGSWGLAWYALLLTCSGIALAGVFVARLHQRLETGLAIERIGLAGLAATAPAYLAAILGSTGGGGITAGASFGGIGLAALVRVVQIARDCEALRAAAADPHPADPPPLGEAGSG